MARLVVRRMAVAMLIAAGAGTTMAVVSGQQPSARRQAIESLSEPGQGLEVRARSANGLVRFAVASDRGLLLPSMAAMPAEARAMAFVELYGEPFGLRARGDARLIGQAPDGIGQEHVRLQQLHEGIPVTAGELLVHLRGDRVLGANGHILSDLPALLAPSVAPAGALEQAQALITKHMPEQAPDARYGEPRLEVFNRGMIDQGTHRTRLAWFIEVTGEALRQYIWVDAQTGGVLLDFSQLTEAKNRAIYNMNHGTPPSPPLPGTLVRSEGQGPVADPDSNQAYDYSGQTYDYFFNNHGRDSYDGVGGQLRSSVHFGTNYQNAFWNGTQMVYGDGFTAADDVVGHELTHAVTDRSSGLFYYYQSGALNESYSDIFGETLDLTNGAGNDSTGVRWLMGEDLPSIGAIRNMMNPNQFGDPGRMSDPAFFCRSDAWTNETSDSGGVHINSGVANHAFALMVDGGTYNGRTVSGIGLQKAAKIQYRVLTTYLTSGSSFADNATALNQSCTDLIGTIGITAGDCSQVANAILAVEMANPWPCAGATPPPATYCPTGGSPVALFADGFESGGVNWTTSSTTAVNWTPSDTDFAKTGLRMAYGPDVASASEHRLAMASAVTLPPNARMSFDHAFEFEHIGTSAFYDGGVLEYSTNGTTWNDAGSLIDGGQAYAGTLAAGNVLGPRSAFVRSSFGYTASRLNLASLAGQAVRFRFTVGTDSSVASLGWLVDNVRLYTCSTASSPPTTANDSYSTPFQTTLQVPAPGVLSNDNSNGGGAMTASLVTNVSSGTLALNADGGFTYTPAAGFSGTATFTYRAVNASGPGNPATVTIAVGGVSTGPEPPTGFYAASIVGNTVTFGWTPPASGSAPTGYVIEGGVGAGSVHASLPTGTVPVYTVVAPSGSFHVRVHTLSGASRSVASNEILIHVNVSVPPSAPTNLLGMVNGSTIALAWKNTFAGGSPSNIVLDVTGSLATSIPLGGTEGFQFPGVPGGTYTLSVRATNGAGSSPPSNSVTLSFPGACSGAPLTPANLLTYKVGSTIFVSWDLPAGGPAPTGYVLLVSGSFNTAIPTGARALSGTVGPGTYNISVYAANSCGNGPATAVQSVTIP